MLDMIKSSYNKFKRYQNTINELNGLSDRELRDIGLNRYDIKRIARKSVC